MAAYDLEEQERIDALKDWWEKWGNWVYAGVVAFALGMLGTQGWRQYQISQNADAEVLFKSVEKTAAEVATSKETKKLSETANAMADKFPKSFQSSESQLMAAKVAFEGNDLEAAKSHLTWVAEKGKETYRAIARLRLAGVLLDEKKYDDAMKQLELIKDEGFQPMVADMRGDILVMQGKRDEARAAYQTAVEKSTDRNPLKLVSQAKLDSVGGSSNALEPATPKTETGSKP